MKHLHYLLGLAVVMLLGFKTASAETVQNYTVDFNTTISTTDHAFKVAPGWKHIVKYRSGWNNTYQVYNYLSTVGVGNTGGLYAGSQPNGTTNKDNMDMLVTPAVTGGFSLDVNKDSNSGSIFFYLIDEDESGALTVGDELTYEATLSTSEYVTLSFTGVEGKRIGIALNYMNIDNFAADQVDIVLEKALTVTEATSSLTGGSVNCDPDGNYSFTYTITVKNTGECDLAADDEGMWVGIAQYQNLGTPVATAPIGQALAMGDEATVEVTANLNFAEYGTRTRFDAVEGMTGTSLTVTPWVEPIEYVAKISVRDADNNDMVEYPNYASAFGAFGMVNSNVTKTMKLRNSGAAPGTVTITMPEGFTASEPSVTVPAGETVEVGVTIDSSTPGIKSGNMVLSGDGLAEDVVIALSGTVLEAGKWFVNFEDQKIPFGCIVENNGWSVNTDSKTISDDNKRYLVSQSRNLNKFITPLLKVEEGEKMSFDVGSLTSYSADDILLNVYYSTDRENWTLITTVPSADLPKTVNPGYNRQYIPKNVVLEGIPAGNVYLAFEAGYVYIDNLYGFELVPVAHDVIISSQKLPASGMQNSDYTATVTLKNLLGEPEEGFTATLYFNNEVVFSGTADALIEAGGTYDFSCTFTPNEVGTFPARLEFDFGDDYVVATDEVEVTITAESAEDVKIVGDPDGALTSSSSYANPITNYYKNGWSEALYTPAMLTAAGMTEGNKITSVTYMGYNPGEVTDNIKVYILSTEEETMAPFAKTDVSELTPAWADEAYKFTVMGASDAPVDLFKVELAEPIVWDGKSLRIVVASDRVSGSDTRTQFLADATLGGELYQGRSDGQSSSAITSLSSAGSYFPVTKFGVEKQPSKVSGKVVDKDGNGLEGVTVTLKSQVAAAEGGPRKAATGQVAYTGTTDENGDFSVDVIQTDKKYDATFSKEGYKDAVVENIDPSNGDVALDEPVAMEAELSALSVLGTFNGWDVSANPMTKNESTGMFEATITVPEAEPVEGQDHPYEFKIGVPNGNGGVATWYGGEDDNHVGYFEVKEEYIEGNVGLTMVDGSNFRLPAAGTYDIKVDPNEMKLYVSRPTVTGVDELKAVAGKPGNVYTIDGRLVRRNATDLSGLDSGIYIFNGKKVLVK